MIPWIGCLFVVIYSFVFSFVKITTNNLLLLVVASSWLSISVSSSLPWSSSSSTSTSTSSFCEKKHGQIRPTVVTSASSKGVTTTIVTGYGSSSSRTSRQGRRHLRDNVSVMEASFDFDNNNDNNNQHTTERFFNNNSSNCYIHWNDVSKKHLPNNDNDYDHISEVLSPKSLSSTTTNCIEFYSAKLKSTISITARSEKDSIPEIQLSASLTSVNNKSVYNKDRKAQIVQSNYNGWMPIEGLFGIYKIPSGKIYVWIVQSDVVYTAPSICNGNATSSNTTDNNEWFTIRKVKQLHLVLVTPNTNDSSTLLHNYNQHQQQQNQEERRQLRLVRKALKHHEWYYCSSSDTNKKINIDTNQIDGSSKNCFNDAVVNNDMTYNIQQTMLTMEEKIKLQNDYNNNAKRRQKQMNDAKSVGKSPSSSWFQIRSNNDIKKNDNKYDIVPSTNNDPHEVESFLPWWDIPPSITRETRNVGNTSQSDSGTFNFTDDPLVRLQEQSPDSRFFWNEAVVECLVHDLKECCYYSNHSKYSSKKHMDDENNTSTAIRTLLHHVIPVTSAFCGVRSNLSTGLNAFPAQNFDNTNMSNVATAYFYDEVIITRRSKFRAGTRFTRRGADATGSVANYAETEQILFIWNPITVLQRRSRKNSRKKGVKRKRSNISSNGSVKKNLTGVVSFVQTRGSIPLRWSSPTDVKTYRPRIRIGTDPIAQARALFLHLADQVHRYCIIVPNKWLGGDNGKKRETNSKEHPSLVLVNLIDKHSDQGRLGRALDAVLKAVLDVYSTVPVESTLNWLKETKIQHLWFDFHAEVKNGRWDRLKSLLDEVKPTLIQHGYFCAVPELSRPTDGDEQNESITSPFRIKKLQTGVFRTNCMDCLDRTNVVQSMFGRYVLFQQIIDLKKHFMVPLAYKAAFRQSPTTLPWTAGESAHRLLWADNADAISRLYAGTPALKGDFTRTGKRTKKGALDDGMNSLQRYYLNNFLDADRQEGIDLLVGYMMFNHLSDDTSVDDATIESTSREDNLLRQRMSVKDAARYMLLGIDKGNGESNQCDREHVRIKLTNRRKREWDYHMKQRKSLDLRWLPGDLQNQFRSSKFPPAAHNIPNEYLAEEALQAMDRRAASDVPWWVVEPELSSESSSSHDKESIASFETEAVTATNGNVGYILSAMLAGTQAPVMLAVVVLSLVAISFPIINL